MIGHGRVFLVDSVHSSDLLRHPDYYVVAAFFIGLLTMSSIQYIVYAQATSSALTVLIYHVKGLYGRLNHRPAENYDAHVADVPNNMSGKGYRTSVIAGEGSLVLRRIPTLTITMFVLVAMSGAAQFASLLSFTLKNGEALCAFEVAWSSMSIQSARLLGLIIMGLSLRSMHLARWEGWMFIASLLALTGMSFAAVVLGNGVLRPTTSTPLPGIPDTFFCYRQHNFRISLATSVLAMVIEGYCIFRCMYLLTPPSAQLLQSLQTASDIRVARGASLFLLDANLLIASSGAAGFYGEFIPVVIAGIVVMAAYNAPSSLRRAAVYHGGLRTDSPPLIDVSRRVPETSASPLILPKLVQVDTDFHTIMNIPCDGQISAPEPTDIEAQYLQACPEKHGTKLLSPNPQTFLGPRFPSPVHSANRERRFSQLSTTVSRSLGTLINAAASSGRAIFTGRPIIPKATLAKQFEEQLYDNTTHFVSETDPRTRYSYSPPSLFSRSASRAETYSDDAQSVKFASRRATVAGTGSNTATLARALTTTMSRKSSVAASMSASTNQSDNGYSIRRTRSIKRYNTFGYKRASYSSIAKPAPSREKASLATRHSSDEEATVPHSNSSSTNTPEPPALPSKRERTPRPPAKAPNTPECANSADASMSSNAVTTPSTSACDGDAPASASSYHFPDQTLPRAYAENSDGSSVAATSGRLSSAIASSSLTHTGWRHDQLSRSATGSSAATEHGHASSSDHSQTQTTSLNILRRTQITPAAPSSFAPFVQGKYLQIGGTHTFTTSSSRASLPGPIPKNVNVLKLPGSAPPTRHSTEPEGMTTGKSKDGLSSVG